jgi:hypothetical protein
MAVGLGIAGVALALAAGCADVEQARTPVPARTSSEASQDSLTRSAEREADLDLPSQRTALAAEREAHLELDLPARRVEQRRVDVESPRPAAVASPSTVDRVRITVSDQRLQLLAGREVLREYSVSTATKGVGSRAGSQRTPLGLHRVHSKFGAGEPLGAVFESRRPTGKIAPIHTAPIDLPEDVITTRILWLEGLEAGKNRGNGVDSHTRYIYIHGTNEEGLIGRPASHGCIRMRNREVVELFDLVGPGTIVEIVE